MTHSLECIETPPVSDECQQQPSEVVSDSAQDIEREERIQHHREQMEAAMREVESSGCFDAMARAELHRIDFYREIAARSPAQRARMKGRH